jgi:aspartate/methionine/tyrosine aminotransferase
MPLLARLPDLPTARLKVAARAMVDPFIAMDVLTAANAQQAAGRDVIHLELGEPAGGPPAAVIEAARARLGERPLGYTEAFGMPALRRAIADHCRHCYGLEVAPARIAVTVGASGAFVLGLLAAFEPGDRVVVPEPAFPAYKAILQALGCEVVRLGLGPETAFKPTLAQLDALPRPLHGLLIASPSNPTGTMLAAAELEAIAGYCRAHGMRLIADEIYHGITYDAPAATALACAPEAIVINGFSKYFCMTGWRLGWMVLPEDLIRPVELLAQNLYISAPALAQEAALVAFRCRAELDRRIETYRANRQVLLERLPEAGLDRFAPVDGAFYLYADVGHLTEQSKTFCERLLADTGVALAPGADFDRSAGHRYIRFAFAGDHARLVEGTDRVVAWLRRQG